MSLLFRTIFTDDRDDLIGATRQCFESWVVDKGIDLEIPEVGRVERDGIEILTASAEEDGLGALRLILHEHRDDERWSTTITVIDEPGAPLVWIDLERESTDPYGRPPIVGVPKIVAALLSSGSGHAGPTRLEPDPVIIGAAGVPDLVQNLLNPDRTVPLVVMSKDRYATTEGSVDRGRQLLTRICGLAPVFVLDEAATGELSTALGNDLHVYGGAVRTYLPGLVIPDPSPRRHSYIAGTVLARQTSAAASRIQRSLAQQAVAQRPPSIYRDRVAYLPGFPRHQAGAGDEELLSDIIDIEGERDQLQAQVGELQDELEFGVLQVDEAERALDAALARIRFLESRLRAAGDFSSANEVTPTPSIPQTAESCAEAIGLARQYLANLEIGDTDAPVNSLDTYMKSPGWGRKAWRALRAMQDYAEMKENGEFAGDFLAYCNESPNGRLVIPAGWVALKESESTDNNPKYRGARTFPVPAEVHEDEEVYMPAHIKIEAGGRPAPRIHFHDDTAGETGMIHVGYYGEHLPNDQTN